MAGLKNRGGFFKVWAHKTALMAQESARSHSKGGMFWPAIARATKVVSASDAGAVIKCEHKVGYHKEHGGTINAKPGSALTIPIAPEAKEKRARDFENTFVFKGTIFQKLGYTSRRRTTISAGGKSFGSYTIKPLFVLKKSVYQKPEPWWPQAAPVLEQGISLAGQQLAREMQK